MIAESKESPPRFNEIKSISSSSAVSQFSIENENFLVIPLDVVTETSEISQVEAACRDAALSSLGYFQFSGHRYLIVIDQALPAKEEIKITTLLTSRELQIASLVAIGWSNKQVAKQLHISEWTVSSHLRRIFVKMQVDSRAAMVYRCAPLINQLRQAEEYTTAMHQTSQKSCLPKENDLGGRNHSSHGG
jgi:DNA-binding CsgD family transcriptional regulator